jgi:flagella basal body P-ring formation protein FlgA
MMFDISLQSDTTRKTNLLALKLVLFSLFLIFCLISNEASSVETNERVTLVKQLSVQNDYVRLKDIFANLPDHIDEDRVISQSPHPGRRAILDSRFLTKLAKIHGVSWRPDHHTDRSVIHRTSVLIPAQDIEDALFDKLKADFDISENDWNIQIDKNQLNIHLPVNSDTSFRFENFWINRDRNQFSTDILAPDSDAPQIRITLNGRFQEVTSVPVLNSQARTGHIIHESDITFKKFAKRRINNEVILRKEDLIGYTPKKFIASNTPVQSFDIQTPLLITKGSLVTVSLNTKNLQLTTKAKALENGSRGERIRLLNTQSNLTIEGEVTGLNQASVDTTLDIAFKH